MIDLITIVFEQELPVLKVQAQSIELYCQDIGIRNIYVVVNDNESVTKQINPAWWGKFSDRVTIINRGAFSTSYVSNGWLSQQALKLQTAAISYNTWSIILDAKSIFTKPLLRSELFDEQGKPCVGQLDVYPVFEPSRQITNKLFNIKLQKQLGPGGVPFLMNNSVVRAMIVEVETLTERDFPTWFQEQGMLTEFILYSGFVQYRYGSLDVLHNTSKNKLTNMNVCHSEVASFDRKFTEMAKSSSVSIHRNAWSQLAQEQRWQYRDFLVERGLAKASLL
jgi:hypothetical protein